MVLLPKIHSIFVRCVWASGLLFVLAACQIELNSGLDEAEANEMMMILLQEGIPTSKTYNKDSTVTLTIKEDNFSDAVNILQARGLPRKKYSDLGSVFKQDSMISTPTEEWARFLYARSQELSQTVGTISGVLSARVHIALPKKDSVLDEPPLPTASVLVRVNSTLVSEDLVPQIKRLVTHSVEQLSYKNVSVVVTPIRINEAQPVLVSLYGLIVHEASSGRLQFVFFGLGFFVLILPIAVFATYFLTRKRQSA